MAEAGEYIELENPISLDKYGNGVVQIQSVGLKFMHRLIHPKFTIHVNEVGGDTRQKGDGHIGGVNFITSPLKKLTTRTADNNNNFTVMCSTYYNGKPVICLIVVIFVQKKSEHEIGIYVFVYIVETKNYLDDY